jgi:hypothetical protein
MVASHQLEEIGRVILTKRPNVVVRGRLLRDVLQVSAGDPELVRARSELLGHRWIMELAREQQPDGSWGRFHSMDSKLKARFPTSEHAIRRALALGLDRESPILAKAVRFMEKALAGQAVWSDRIEKSDWWPVGVEAISAGTLAQVDPANPVLRKAWEYWAEVAERSLATGQYDQEAEVRAHQELLKLKLVYLRSRYVLTLLGARSSDLPARLERRLVDWIWNDPQGIGYLGADMKHPETVHINNWLESLEILSCFGCTQGSADGAMEWLWQQRNEDGLWDFGPRTGKTHYFPLSDDWRGDGRQIDHSTRVLALLRSFAC